MEFLNCYPSLEMPWLKRVALQAGTACVRWMAGAWLERPDALPDSGGLWRLFKSQTSSTQSCFCSFLPTSGGHKTSHSKNLHLRVCFQGNPICNNLGFFGLMFISPIVTPWRQGLLPFVCFFPTYVSSTSAQILTHYKCSKIFHELITSILLILRLSQDLGKSHPQGAQMTSLFHSA